MQFNLAPGDTIKIFDNDSNALAYFHHAVKEKKLTLQIFDGDAGCTCGTCYVEKLDFRAQVAYHAWAAELEGLLGYTRYHKALAAYVMEQLDDGHEVCVLTGEAV